MPKYNNSATFVLMNGLTIEITAKTSDMFYAQLRDGNTHVGECNGYVPPMFRGKDGDEDYVRLKIDVDTGTIIGWKKPTVKQLNVIFDCVL